MAESNYLPNADAALALWGTNFATVATTNETTLKLTTAQVNAVTGLASTFVDANATLAAAKQAGKNATTARNVAKRQLVAAVRPLVKQIQGTPDIPDALKTALGITVSSGRRPEVPVFQPTPLNVVLQPDMRVYLKWGKNGNHYGTLYVVERRCGLQGTWLLVKTVTAARFYDTGCSPGTQATYRVTATRGHFTSQPSPEVSIYPSTM